MSMRKLFDDEHGVAAIVVTVIVMLILVVTTLGIATITRREQRQSLDRQLSAEAYYAAESGVNDVIQKLKANPALTSTDCSNPNIWNSNAAHNNLVLPDSIGDINTLGGITAQSQYSCVLTESQPTSLEYSQIASDSGVSADFTTTDKIKSLVVGWENYLGSTSTRPDCSNYTALSNYPLTVPGSWASATPMLKIDITNLSAGFGRNTMSLNTNSFYLYPCSGAGNVSINFVASTGLTYSSTNNAILPGYCDTANVSSPVPPNKLRRCNVVINFGGIGPSQLLIRIKPIYSDAKVSVAALDNSNSPLAMTGGQKVIDVTGKSSDVVRRIQVRYSESSQYLFALDSVSSLCKRLKVTPNSGSADTAGIAAQADKDLCNPDKP